MPEFAEVETSRQQLLGLVGQTLEWISIRDEKLSLLPKDIVVGRKLDDVVRHGKLLGFVFGDEVLACHFRMTGKILFEENEKARAVLAFSDQTISFVDARRFGTLEIMDLEVFGSKMGPDLVDQHQQAVDAWDKVARSGRAVKEVLLDQTKIAGIGNYMVDEALWRTYQDPNQTTSSLDKSDWTLIIGAAKDVGLEALSQGGVSIRDYQQPSGKEGAMQFSLACYGRAGKPCLRCSTTLEKTTVGGRGTTFCPECQHSNQSQ